MGEDGERGEGEKTSEGKEIYNLGEERGEKEKKGEGEDTEKREREIEKAMMMDGRQRGEGEGRENDWKRDDLT